MNGSVGQLDQSFAGVWVSNSGAIGKGVSSKNLAPQQIGVFPADVSCVKGDVLSLVAPSFKNNKRLVLKQGIKPFAGQGVTGLSKQDKKQRTSIEFEAGDVVEWYGLRGDSIVLPEIVALGYDGFDATKTLTTALDAKEFIVNIRLAGEPIKRFFHTNFVNFRIAIDKKLCLGTCECYDACGKVPADLIADAIIKQVEEGYLFHQVKGGQMYRLPARQFIKVNKLKKCDTPLVAPVLTEMKKYEVSIADDGYSSLADIASNYGNVKIELEKRVNFTSTYSMWLPAADPAPANFTMTKHVLPVCDTCPTCPDTYTTVPAVKVVQVRVACGAAAPVLAGAISTTLITSSLDGGDLYVIKMPLATTDTTINAALAALGCSVGAMIGVEDIACVGTAVTFSWTSCESCFQTTKEWMMVLPDTNCDHGDSRLAELQAAYPELVITDDVAGACVHSYKTTTKSTCESAEDCGKLVTYEFEKPAGYGGFQWEEVHAILATPSCAALVATPSPCCVTGVTFETAFWSKEHDACTFGWSNYHPNDMKPVRVQVNTHVVDWTENTCDVTPVYTSVLQQLKMPLGMNGELLQEYERSFLIYEGKTWNSNPYSNKNNGFVIAADPHVTYDQYVLGLKRRQYGDSFHQKDQGRMYYNIFVPAGEGKELETVMNQLVLSANPDLKAVVL